MVLGSNFDKNFQWEVSQIAEKQLSVNLNHLKTHIFISTFLWVWVIHGGILVMFRLNHLQN